MDTTSILILILAAGVFAVLLLQLHYQARFDQLRLDVSELLANTDETHAMLVELALEDAAYTYAGEGDEEYCTYTTNGVAK